MKKPKKNPKGYQLETWDGRPKSFPRYLRNRLLEHPLDGRNYVPLYQPHAPPCRSGLAIWMSSPPVRAFSSCTTIIANTVISIPTA